MHPLDVPIALLVLRDPRETGRPHTGDLGGSHEETVVHTTRISKGWDDGGVLQAQRSLVHDVEAEESDSGVLLDGSGPVEDALNAVPLEDHVLDRRGVHPPAAGRVQVPVSRGVEESESFNHHVLRQLEHVEGVDRRSPLVVAYVGDVEPIVRVSKDVAPRVVPHDVFLDGGQHDIEPSYEAEEEERTCLVCHLSFERHM